MIPGSGIAKVGGFHGSIAVIAAISLRVSVVVTAATIVVTAVDYPVLAFGLIVNGGSVSVIPPQPHSWCDEDAINLVSHDRDRRPIGDRNVVESSHGWPVESAVRRLNQVVAVARLIVKRRDPAISIGAESILRLRVRVSTRIPPGGLHHADVQSLAVRLTHDLIQRAVVGCVKSARAAVSRHAGRAPRGVNITRTFRPGRSVAACCGSDHQGGNRQHERQRECYCETDSGFHDYSGSVGRMLRLRVQNTNTTYGL